VLADSISATHCNDRDFGTSRTGSYRIKLHRLLGRAEGGAMTTHGPERHLVRCSDSVDFRELQTSRRHPNSVVPDPNRMLTCGQFNNSAPLFFSQVSIEMIV
jgi:hypothetical protein